MNDAMINDSTMCDLGMLECQLAGNVIAVVGVYHIPTVYIASACGSA